ncbi:hypothetical protein [Thauera linaloolentis]|uniref:Transmembrane protein n=1 Tax=Thauera linaloolentis (strain DSM 12138 / JCM 21573 / CCUG 41526 / CIP 105981 / IAM 15112 / NBRC 102519 / 47Lol) TaxID=1123367 RepID=N6YUF2_THAL4|nr:hypothetical protein [Thauera linaloolentis]ENO86027.1 hypothetical protein C666_14195 [Thauera linaloolentis 47Lol = DSM 12138]MCM8567385.1 hypothetical protein [Thauera linaloolentis]
MKNTHASMAVRGLLYKEWIKLRYLGLLPFALLLIALGDSFYDMHGLKSANGGQALWHAVIFRSHMPFEPMRYLPLSSGIWLAAVQFAPECLNRRLRLFFHLPVDEHKALCLILGLGAGLLSALTGGLCLAQAALISLFMPVEAARLSILALTPWCLAGFVAYAVTALIFIETSPVRRLWHAGIGAVFVLALTDARGYGSHVDGLPWFGLIAALWFAAIGNVLERAKRGGGS